MAKFRLYVWTRFCTDYSDGLAFAIARDEAEARKLVIQEYSDGDYDPHDWGDLEIRELNEPFARAEPGGG